MKIEYLHTMVRVKDIDASKRFYCDLLGLEVRAETRLVQTAMKARPGASPWCFSRRRASTTDPSS